MKKSSRKPNYKEIMAKYPSMYNLAVRMEWLFIKNDKSKLRKWMSKKQKRKSLPRFIKSVHSLKSN